MNAALLHSFTHLGNLMTELLGRVMPNENVSEDAGTRISTQPDDGIETMQDIMMMKLAYENTDDVVFNESNIENSANEDKTMVFQRNQNTIKRALETYVTAHGKLPSTTKLADITGLSRPTVHNHLKEGSVNAQFKHELSKMQILSADLLVKLYKMGNDGDARAIKMLMDIIIAGYKVQIPQQTNYIQINSLRVQNQNLDKLSPKSKAKIEKIIRTELKMK